MLRHFIRIGFVVIIILAQSINCADILILDECPGRDVPTIRQRSAETEVSMIYYYASWNRESRLAKEAYTELATYHMNNVYFAAVDCWHFACNCSRTHEITASYGMGMPHTWPTLMVRYGRRGHTLQYHGEWNLPALTRFINNLYKPLERIQQKSELKQLVARCDAVVLGLFSNGDVMAYNIFVTAAVKWLENDPERSFCFTVALGAATINEVLSNKGATEPQILLLSRHGIETFTNDSKSNVSNQWQVTKIITWTQTTLKRIYSHTLGYSTPAILATRLRATNAPVLLIFANELSFPQHFYTQMADVAQHKPSASTQHDYCMAYWRQSAVGQTSEKRFNHTNVNRNQCQGFPYINSHNLQYYFYINEQLRQLFQQFQYGPPAEQQNVKFSSKKAYNPEMLLQQQKISTCTQHPHFHTPAMRIAIAKYLQKTVEKLRTATTPLPRNGTLSLLLLDTAKCEDFLTALSPLSSKQDIVATAAIVDPQLESVFLMHESYTFDALLHFVRSYYLNQLAALQRESAFSSYSFSQVPSALNTVYLRDYNRKTFLNVIEQHNFTTVVLLYSPACAFSTIYTHVLLQLSTFLLHEQHMRFLRLNTQSNDLPWEFVMPTTPTLIVFPRGRMQESRVFPSHMQVNTRNVLGFILAQLDPLDQVSTIWRSCQQIQLPQRIQKCLQFTKSLVTQHIAHHLKFWQIFVQDRPLVLNRLKEFKDISLHIQHSFKV